ncbi:hypothetical protein [Streptomyces yaizuensis]|uniref:Uncharacterized protein n=1 Tax=Streptomyces yaizuensis TaxID=2989713 RepID=A0ABQ5P9T9_9ACTN|nr:hypothetical protein [Streptomyces sp. YSPA8]GLF99337.1 hypothetical protein SYYSPA8_33590 [Streptomyces sp. YSPA8]
MRSRIIIPALALGGAVVLGTTLLVNADDSDASPTATATSTQTRPPGAPVDDAAQSAREKKQEKKNVTAATQGSAQENSAAARQSQQSLADAGLSIPDGWRPVQVREEKHEDRAVTVVRYEQGTERTIGGEHITSVVDGEGTLLGYTRMTLDAAGSSVPSSSTAEKAAFDWMERFVPEHSAGLSVQWVDQHDEEVRDESGAKHTISGAKVKSHHENGLYTWVIVDDEGEVISYERDIRWDGSAGRRATQMWLHDKWIAAREGSGPQPESPYARA